MIEVAPPTGGAWMHDGVALRNTCWSGGRIDCAGERPRVCLTTQRLTPLEWDGLPRENGGKNLVAGVIPSGGWAVERTWTTLVVPGGRLPVIGTTRARPLAVALMILYEVPLMLRDTHERAWMIGFGGATGIDKLADILLAGMAAPFPLYQRVIVHAPSARPRARQFSSVAQVV